MTGQMGENEVEFKVRPVRRPHESLVTAPGAQLSDDRGCKLPTHTAHADPAIAFGTRGDSHVGEDSVAIPFHSIQLQFGVVTSSCQAG